MSCLCRCEIFRAGPRWGWTIFQREETRLQLTSMVRNLESCHFFRQLYLRFWAIVAILVTLAISIASPLLDGWQPPHGDDRQPDEGNCRDGFQQVANLMKSHFQPHHEEKQTSFARLDTNQDGVLTREEFVASCLQVNFPSSSSSSSSSSPALALLSPSPFVVFLLLLIFIIIIESSTSTSTTITALIGKCTTWLTISLSLSKREI